MVPKGTVCVRCLPVPQQPHVLDMLVRNRATAVGDTQVDLLGMGTCLLALPPEDDAYRFAQRLPIKHKLGALGTLMAGSCASGGLAEADGDIFLYFSASLNP